MVTDTRSTDITGYRRTLQAIPCIRLTSKPCSNTMQVWFILSNPCVNFSYILLPLQHLNPIPNSTEISSTSTGVQQRHLLTVRRLSLLSLPPPLLTRQFGKGNVGQARNRTGWLARRYSIRLWERGREGEWRWRRETGDEREREREKVNKRRDEEKKDI